MCAFCQSPVEGIGLLLIGCWPEGTQAMTRSCTCTWVELCSPHNHRSHLLLGLQHRGHRPQLQRKRGVGGHSQHHLHGGSAAHARISRSAGLPSQQPYGMPAAGLQGVPLQGPQEYSTDQPHALMRPANRPPTWVSVSAALLPRKSDSRTVAPDSCDLMPTCRRVTAV